ncbi:MAG: hypothetical protein JO300_06125 [Silvibacterium sp.]|nr:hypothetical protein [Silvibacterium sp.]MBV8437865.1 hypothetical protein [Silvibacterium sp.]
MFKNIRIYIFAAGFAAIAFMVAPKQFAAQNSHTLTIVNRSGFEIDEIHISSVGDRSWERDRLGADVLRSGHKYIFSGILPGYYDIKLIDEDNDSCILKSVFVNNNLTWTLNPPDLVGCETHLRGVSAPLVSEEPSHPSLIAAQESQCDPHN